MTRARARAVSILLLSLVAVLSAQSLELGEGTVKLVVNDITGRVAFYRLAEIGRNRYEPLLFDADSRTTFATLSLDSRYYRLGDSVEFRFSLVRIDHGVVIYYKSPSCMVRQRIEFIKSEGSAIVDTFRMSFEIENTGGQDIRVGLRMLLDTWLGEKDGQHFSTGTQSKVTEETRIARDMAERSITSSGENASLRVDLAGEGITPPDEIVLANWKRMSDSNWSFEASGLRGFSFAPFSINDSCLALFWNPENLPRYAVRKLSFTMVAMPGKAAAAKTSSDAKNASSVPLMTAQPLPGAENQNASGSPATATVPTPTTAATSTTSETSIQTAGSQAPNTGIAAPTIVTSPSSATSPASGTTTSGAAAPTIVTTPASAAAPGIATDPASAAATPTAPVGAIPAQGAVAAVPSEPTMNAGVTAIPATAPTGRMATEADIAELWDLLDKINAGLANPASVTDAQMLEWTKRIAAIQARFKGK